MSVLHVSLKADDVDVGDIAAHVEQDVGGKVAVLIDDRDEQVGNLPTRVVAQLPRSAEVGERDASVGRGEEIPRMRVGMVEAVDEDLFVVADDALPGDLVAVDAVRVQLLEPVERDALHALEREDGRGRALPVHLWKEDVVVALEHVSEPLGVARLVYVVAFPLDRVRELVDQAHHVVAAPQIGAALDAGRLGAEDVEVGRDDRFDARPLHFDRDRLPVVEHRHVHLADARRSGRNLRELGEELGERLAEHRLDLCFDLLEWERLHLVLELGEFLGE